jgi:hypothetical protein
MPPKTIALFSGGLPTLGFNQSPAFCVSLHPGETLGTC